MTVVGAKRQSWCEPLDAEDMKPSVVTVSTTKQESSQAAGEGNIKGTKPKKTTKGKAKASATRQSRVMHIHFALADSSFPHFLLISSSLVPVALSYALACHADLFCIAIPTHRHVVWRNGSVRNAYMLYGRQQFALDHTERSITRNDAPIRTHNELLSAVGSCGIQLYRRYAILQLPLLCSTNMANSSWHTGLYQWTFTRSNLACSKHPASRFDFGCTCQIVSKHHNNLINVGSSSSARFKHFHRRTSVRSSAVR